MNCSVYSEPMMSHAVSGQPANAAA